MNSQDTMNKIKEMHSQLYDDVIKISRVLIENDNERNLFIERIKHLIKEIYDYAVHPETVKEYIWLSETVADWQNVLLSTLNMPIDLGILPLPSKPILPPLPSDRALTEIELRDWQSKLAEILGISRLIQFRRMSSDEEKNRDWLDAQVYLASDILNGFPNFASRISSASYKRLEDVWVNSVKRLRAYFVWQKEKEEIEYPQESKHYYYKVCGHIRDMFVNRIIKARIDEFGEAKTYLETYYLTDDKIDIFKAEELIKRKAERIKQKTGETDESKNWRNAEFYTRMFYENIIPAVIDKDNKKEKILTVLKAFQYSNAPENRWGIINCFEAALVIYFLDPDVITDLWEKSEPFPKPASSFESKVQVKNWPKKFEIPDGCKDYFRYSENEIIFKGMMIKAQKDSLLNKLEESELQNAVESLFLQSRLIHRLSIL